VQNKTSTLHGNNSSNTNVSGSFGGKPKTIRNTATNKTKKIASIPAWLSGENLHQNDSN
jgi:hypothetical protein